MNCPELNRWIGYLTLAAGVCLLVRLIWLGMVRRYWGVFGYLLADTLQVLLAAGARTGSRWYGYVYLEGRRPRPCWRCAYRSNCGS